MAKSKQFILTLKESKELRATGRTVHAYGGIGYVIEFDVNDGNAKVTALEPLAIVDYEVIVRR